MKIELSGGSATGRKIGLGCVVAFLIPFFAVSIFTLVAALRAFFATGDFKQGGFMLIFALGFGAIPGAILWAVVSGYRRQQRINRIKAENPGRPWLVREDWTQGHVTCSAAARMWVMIGVAVLWNAISAPAALAVPAELAKGNKLILLALLFPLVGMGLIAAAVYTVAHYRKFGRSVFEMASVPGVVGGYLAGTIRLQQPLLGAHQVELRLVNINRVVTGSGKHQTTHEHVLWESEMALEVDADIPVAFAIPANARETNMDNDRNSILWRLEVKAELPGVDYSASFEVPVFKVAEARSVPTGILQLVERNLVRRETEAKPAEIKNWFNRYGPNGPEFDFPPGRAPGFALVSGLISAGMLTGAWFMWMSNIPKVFAAGLGLFGLLAATATASALLGRSRVTKLPGMMRVETSCAGLKRTREIALDQIDRFEIRVAANMGSREYFDVRAVLKNGKVATLTRWIYRRRDADWVVAQLKEHMRA